MSDFRKQIEEDIREYQERYSENSNFSREEWAFNFWVLDKFFYEEQELALDKIIDGHDRGVDAYVYYEDSKELYLIQNKYYTTAKVTEEYVRNNFLLTPLQVLEAGSYARCPELQQIYTRNQSSERFTVRLQLYVTNNLRDSRVEEAVREFNSQRAPRVMAQLFYLSDMEEKWYGEPRHSTTELTALVESVNQGTILSINNDAYHLDNNIDAKYVFTPVTCIYQMFREAQEKHYALFEKNIREYLGRNRINGKIYETLRSREDRKNFFYYNNGITLICEKIGPLEAVSAGSNPHVSVRFSVKNPQIVNGCQTVNSIHAALRDCDPDDLQSQFQDAFVMLKVLEIDSQNQVEDRLSKDIVTYNNSQNSIDEKTFVANSELFQRLKNEFEAKGYLLLTKQSDKNSFATKYAKVFDMTSLKGRSVARRQVFGLEVDKKLSDLHIPLERLLQVALAFKEGGDKAYTLKKDLLKPGAAAYESVVEFIRSSNVTTDVLLGLYLLFLRAEKAKKANAIGGAEVTAPIPFYLIDAFGKYECQERSPRLIPEQLNSRAKVDGLISLYSKVTKSYSKRFRAQHNVDYIKMIKMPVDYAMLATERDMYND